MISDDVLGTIRDTWLVTLRHGPGDEAGGDEAGGDEEGGAEGRVVVALATAGTSPANADAIALRCVADIERNGGMAGASTLVSYGATLGASVAMIAAARGLTCVVVLDDVATQAQHNRIRAYGADVRVIPVRGSTDEPSTVAVAARRIASQAHDAVLVEKRRSGHGPAEEDFGAALLETVGDDLFAVVGAERDALTLAGVRHAVATRKADVAVVALSFDGTTWSGTARGAPLLVSERDALSTARRLAADEGILGSAGIGGAAVAAAQRLVADAPAGATVVALVPAADHGDLITAYDDGWWKEHHGGDTTATLSAAEILGHKEQGPGDLVTLAPGATVVEAIRIMRDLEVSQIPVFRDDRIVGTIREDQVIDLLLHAPERKDGPVEAVMEDPLPEIDEDATVDELQSLLVRGGSAVIVRRHDGQRAILTKYDLIHALTRG
jgi:cystathionine beta-synthase